MVRSCNHYAADEAYVMKKMHCSLICLGLMVILCGCAGRTPAETSVAEENSGAVIKETDAPEAAVIQESGDSEITEQAAGDYAEKGTGEGTEMEMKLLIGNTPVEVIWEENESTDALKELVKESPVEIQMSMYGGFEQVGALGTSLPRDDVQTTTSAGDIVLYSGNQIVVFYGSNSWAYTRLGKITDKSAADLKDLLGNEDVTITIFAEADTAHLPVSCRQQKRMP